MNVKTDLALFKVFTTEIVANGNQPSLYNSKNKDLEEQPKFEELALKFVHN